MTFHDPSKTAAKTDRARNSKKSRPQDGAAAKFAAVGPSSGKKAIVNPLSQPALALCDMPTKHQSLSAWVLSALLSLLSAPSYFARISKSNTTIFDKINFKFLPCPAVESRSLGAQWGVPSLSTTYRGTIGRKGSLSPQLT